MTDSAETTDAPLPLARPERVAAAEMTAVLMAAPDSDSDTETNTKRPPRRLRPWALPITTFAACAPILIAAIRAALGGWRATGDLSYMTLNADRVLSRHPPLLGTWSSASHAAGRDFNHPGPLLYDFLAVPVEVFGPDAGTAIGMALVNIAAVLAIAWLVRRRFGPNAAALATCMCALLVWSMGSDMLFNVWNPFAVLWAFAAFLVAGWCLASGDPVAAPVMVVAGSLVLQTHLSYAVLVPGMTVAAVVGAVVVLIQRGRPFPIRRALLWSGISLVTAVVVWAQPLWEQFVDPEGTEGNLTLLAKSADTESAHPTFEQAAGALAGTVALPPMWLAPSFGSPRYGYWEVPPPLSQAGPALVALLLALGALGWRACRRGSKAVGVGCVMAFVAVVLGLVTLVRMPIMAGMQTSYGRFMWPLGLVVWLALAFAVVDELRARGLSRRSPRLAGAGLAVTVVVAIVAGLAAIPTVDHGSQPQWTRDAMDTIDDDLIAGLEEAGGGPFLIHAPYHTTTGYLSPPIMALLQDKGIDFFVRDVDWARQFGTYHGVGAGGRFEQELYILGGTMSRSDVEGGRLIAYWSDLSEADQAELDEINADLEDIVAEHGVPLTPAGDIFMTILDEEHRTQLAEAPVDAEAFVSEDRLLLDLAGYENHEGQPALDPTVFDPDTMQRWIDLSLSREYEIGIWLKTVE